MKASAKLKALRKLAAQKQKRDERGRFASTNALNAPNNLPERLQRLKSLKKESVEIPPGIPSIKVGKYKKPEIVNKTEFARNWAHSWNSAPKDLLDAISSFDEPEEDTRPTSSAYYLLGSINMASYSRDAAQGQAIFRHEYGHHLDAKMGQETGRSKLGVKLYIDFKQYFSSSSDFHRALRNDESSLLETDARSDAKMINLANKELSAYQSHPFVSAELQRKPGDLAHVGRAIVIAKIQDDVSGSGSRTAEEARQEVLRRIQEVSQTSLAARLYQNLPSSMQNYMTGCIALAFPDRPQVIARLSDMAINQRTGVSDDLLSALTQGKMGVGHTDDYWAADPVHRPNTEAFANMVSIYGSGHPLADQVLETIAPKSFAMFKKSLRQVSNG